MENAEESILNIIYGEDEDSFIDKWVKEYINKRIEKLIPEANISYVSESDTNGAVALFKLIKKTENVKKGYLYNTNSIEFDTVFEVKVLKFDEKNLDCEIVISNKLYTDINYEINKRVTKELDKESLHNISLKFDSAISTKEKWTKLELIILKNRLLKEHKQLLYNSVLKQIKKINKKQSKKSPNTLNINERAQLYSSCKMEYTMLNKEV
jgi:hypothetical protein